MNPLRSFCLSLSLLLLTTVVCQAGRDEEYFDQIEPILADYCYDCHGDGAKKGDFAMDEYDPKKLSEHFDDHHHWHALWENVRAEIMPPANKQKPTPEERALLLSWIEQQVFRLDPKNPDPGRVTVRRLNRTEYRHTIEDIFGIYFNTGEFFPADDTGHGFDTIGDVLSMSPLVTQRYIDAAQDIVSQVVVTEPVIPKTHFWWNQFKHRKSGKHRKRLRFDHPERHDRDFSVEHAGQYQMSFTYRLPDGGRETDNTAIAIVRLDDKEIARKYLAWGDSSWTTISKKVHVTQGNHRLTLEVVPKNKPGGGQKPLELEPRVFEAFGPLDGSHKVYPSHYKKIFVNGKRPETEVDQSNSATWLIDYWGKRLMRRPLTAEQRRRLIDMYKGLRGSGLGYEAAFAQCMTAMLASPGFIFRSENQPEPNNPGKIVPIDEYALASRLSYFLWSSCPDQELMELAEKGQLRQQLDSQLDRMLADNKTQRFVENFVGQWLQTRDIMNAQVSPSRALDIHDYNKAKSYFTYDIRKAMRHELHSLFGHILKENRPVTEFLTADYTFINEPLAFSYGIEGIKGKDMRRIDLPADSPRGGILGSGGFLVVTSNPTRTSPVKRGLFVLENLLATPAPPAPPNVPTLEAASKESKNRDLTMRQLMEVHRENKVCASCHARMDPIGLALENFTAIGTWRDEENKRKIEAQGQLVTGETFGNARDLAHILATDRRQDFYRCLAEKLLIYGLGRGVEYYDAVTLNQLVETMESGDDRMQTLIKAVIHSAPFQKRRGDAS